MSSSALRLCRAGNYLNQLLQTLVDISLHNKIHVYPSQRGHIGPLLRIHSISSSSNLGSPSILSFLTLCLHYYFRFTMSKEMCF